MGIIFLLFVCSMFLFMFKDPMVIKYYDVDINYREDYNILEKIGVKTNKVIDTTKLHSGEIVETHDGFKYVIKYNVKDMTPPVMMWVGNVVIKKGDKFNYKNRLLCVDNYDKSVSYTVSGEYDLNKLGKYNLKYVAVDSSGNKTEKKFTLTVVEEYSSSSSSSSSNDYFSFDELKKNYKKDNTLVGIDVSSWQGDINWKKVKDAGCDFAIIRVGFGHKNNELVYDTYFKDNLIEAQENGIKVGLYFYSYAKTVKEAEEQATWIIDSLDGRNIELPIAFDFEDWSNFKKYKMSLYDINDVANAFMNKIENSGYNAMLYGRASYLNNIWFDSKYPTWLAHYTRKTDFSKNYYIWQLSNNGRIDGIYGAVDLNVLYKK